MTTDGRRPCSHGAGPTRAHPSAPDAEPPLIRNRDFQALWVSRFFAGLGKESGEVAYPLLVLLLVGSATHAGIIGAAQVTAAMVAAVLGGSIADRGDRRVVLLFCDFGRLALLASFACLVISDTATVPVIMGVAVASSLLMGVANPVAMAAVKQLVPPSQVAAAAAQNQIRFFSTTALGPPVAGGLFGLGRAFPFVAEALSYLVSAVLVLCVRRPMQTERGSAPRPWGVSSAVGGFRVIARNTVLRPLMAWIVVFNLAFTGTGAVLAIIATAESKGAGDFTIGLTVSLAGSGGLVGALAAGLVVRLLRPSTVFRVAAWGAPVCAVALAATPGVLSLGLLVGAVFAVVPSVNALFYGYIATSVPDGMQGRVLGAVSFLCLVSQPIGILGVGVVFDLAGPTWVFLYMAAVSGLAALISLTPTMRDLPRPEEIAPA